MSAYYQLLSRYEEVGVCVATYRSHLSAQGAWNPNEQHMAPASGLMALELERFLPREDMRLARIGFDIFGLIAFGECTITTRMIRPGRTIELIEAQMSAAGKTCIVARAWRMLIQDSQAIHGLEDAVINHPDCYENWTGMQRWPGGYIQSIDFRADPNNQAGKGIVWLNNDLNMVDGQKSSDFVHLMGMVDTANGTAPRQNGELTWAFPNLDLQIHMHRYPSGKWLGLETVQQYGADGVGLTSAILHDVQGPFGRSEQILSLRPLS